MTKKSGNEIYLSALCIFLFSFMSEKNDLFFFFLRLEKGLGS